MKVYIVAQEWQGNYDRQFSIEGVFDSLEKAQKRLKELYNDDVEWINEHKPESENFEENYITDYGSYVFWEEYWSDNSIIEKEIQ